MISNPLFCSPYFKTYYQKNQKEKWKLKAKLVGLANPQKSLFQLFLSLSPYSKIVRFSNSFMKIQLQEEEKKTKQIQEQKKNKKQIKNGKQQSQSPNHKCYKSRSIQNLQIKWLQIEQSIRNQFTKKEFNFLQLFLSSQCQFKQYLQNLMKILDIHDKIQPKQPKYTYCHQYVYFVNKILEKHTEEIQKMPNSQNQQQKQKRLNQKIVKSLFGISSEAFQKKQISKYFINHVKNIRNIIDKKKQQFKRISKPQKLNQEKPNQEKLNQKKLNVQNVQQVNYNQILKELYQKQYKLQLGKQQCKSIKTQIQHNIQKLSILTNQQKIQNLKRFFEIHAFGKDLSIKNTRQYFELQEKYPIIIQDIKYKNQYETYKKMSTLHHQILLSNEVKKQIKEKLIDDVMKNLIIVILEFMQTRHKNKFKIMLKPEDFILYPDTAQYELNMLCLIPYQIGLQEHPYTMEQQITFCTPHQYDYYQLIKTHFDKVNKKKEVKQYKYLLNFTNQHFFMIYFMILLLKFGQQNPFKQIQKQQSINEENITTNMENLIQKFQEQLKLINGFKEKENVQTLQNIQPKRRYILEKFIEILQNQFLPSKILIALTHFRYHQHFQEISAKKVMASLLNQKDQAKSLKELIQQIFSHQLRKLNFKKKKLKNIMRQIQILQMLNFVPLIASKKNKSQGKGQNKNQGKMHHINDQVQIQSYYFYLLMKEINDFLFMCTFFFGQNKQTKQLLKILNFNQDHLPANCVQKYAYKVFENKFSFLQSCFTKVLQKTFQMQQTYKKNKTQKEPLSKVKQIGKNMFAQQIDANIYMDHYTLKQQQLFNKKLVRMIFKDTCLYFLKSSFQIMEQFELQKLKKWTSNQLKKNVLIDLFVVLTSLDQFDFIQRQIWTPIVLHEQKKTKSDQQFYSQIKNLMVERKLEEKCSQQRSQFQTRRQELKKIEELSKNTPLKLNIQ